MIKQEIEKVEKEIKFLEDKTNERLDRFVYLEKLKATLTTLKKCQKIIEERDKSELEFLNKVFDDLGHDPECITNFVARNLKERISFLEGQK